MLWGAEFAAQVVWSGFWLDSGVLEPVVVVFSMIVGPVMGAGGVGGWVGTRLVRVR